MSKTWVVTCVGLVGAGLMLARGGAATFDAAEALGVWLFDEGSGDVVMDSSGNGIDGTFNGAPAWVDGRFGTALSFDGDDDYVEMSDPVNVSDGTHTISVWVNPGEGPQKNYCDLLGNHTGDVKGYDIEQRVDETNAFYHGMGVGGAWQGGPPPERPATQLEAGVWQHLVVQKDGATVRHYLNGEMTVEYDVAAEAIDASAANLRIGLSQAAPGRETQAIVDEVVIVDHVLSMAEIMELGLGVAGGGAAVSSQNKLATTWASLRAAY